ncbi:toxin-antitoxin system, toxin component [Streptomyces sp. NPDC057245]|uniref:toxin-antitoxin system, toxin component n=1 Tax=Streptomyces sp. NPDC057245 TaxID=3346065 RepID=UPI0036458ACB
MSDTANPHTAGRAGVRSVDDAGARTMRRLVNRVVNRLEPPTHDDELLPALGQALSEVRGRPVRLRKEVFPPETASGLWIDADDFDLIVIEKNTDPDHQLVICGHESWHMFAGHCGAATAHGPAAARSLEAGTAAALQDLVSRAVQGATADLPPTDRMDASLHIAALRADSVVHEETEAEMFGVKFATVLQAALEEARTAADLGGIAGRIQVSMAHRWHRS